MCGIVGYTGPLNAGEVLLKGLSLLEYRGYDSAGIALFEKDDISISLYPNPTSENSLLSVKGLNEDATVVVTDVQGKVIASSKLMKGHQTMEIESARLASGIYYVRVQTANSVRTEKLIKK